jgi:hypothetical protein
MAQFLITLTQANEFPQRSLKVLLYKESIMDPLTHTIFVLCLMFVANIIGKKMGRQEGISAAVTYLIEMGAVSDDALKRANEKYEEGDY